MGSTGPAGAEGATGPLGQPGAPGAMGADGATGPTGPAGVIASYRMAVENDQGMVGTTISGTYQATPTPAALVVPAAPAGTYLLTWYAEVMRTTAGGGSYIFARLRDVTMSTTRGFLRDGSGVENGPPGAMPTDTDLFLSGDILPFSGSVVVTLPAGAQTYRLEYALSTCASASEAVRARRQRITLLRLE